MGFPSPAMDYQESRLSLDSYCKTGRPGVPVPQRLHLIPGGHQAGFAADRGFRRAAG
jgi:hypothetical protein